MEDKISVIIPVKNEEGSIKDLLDSLLDQTHKPDEIVITDGGSKDATVKIIEEYIARGYPIKLIKTTHAYPGKARNLAVESSSYELIAMTDAGIKLDKNWLKELLRPLEEGHDLDVVYGNYEPVTDTFFKECLAIAFVPAPRAVSGALMRLHFIASSLMKKKVWRSVGGFPDFRAAEDRIFMEKVGEGSFRIAFAPAAKVMWNIPSDFRSVFRRFSLYSMHDLMAGRYNDWHLAVIRMYLAAIAAVLLGVFVSPFWFIILALAAIARILFTVINKTRDEGPLKKFNIAKVVLIGIIIIWIDIAMFSGLIKYFMHRMAKGRA